MDGPQGPAPLMGFSHVSLSVRDRDRSERWYCDVLGFETFEHLDEGDYREAILLHRASGTILCVQQHHANEGEEFDPRRTGGDHVAFRVGRRADLGAWKRRLEDLGVTHSDVADREYGSVLCFKDPDRIQLELFYRDDHP
ncbi:MAG TPA: VOC family protein [Actinomycetota bacterium]|nr:VOC family protein [Actinomycetota bacterium]